MALCREILDTFEDKVLPGVTLTCSSSLESYRLNTDRFRLHQLLGHLLSNAVKFTHAGEVNLSFETDQVNNSVRFIITDTGCGIPVEMHDKIFERFEKLDEFKQGTGLGLAICRNIANRFQGSLYLDTSYMEGARFVFVHPCGLEISKN
ncbi:MAG: HAMP domain-containing histidine kinase [Parabacteroides sp.]|nr:HAMP domain-containing histidine kinase [Parabacteroides sp.]